ncbi:DUF3187 family protein [Luminiphilus sp.]|nr:DUF3187 family protein [Luminiphilus sp.]
MIRFLKIWVVGGSALICSTVVCAATAPLAVSNLSPFSLLRALPEQRTAQAPVGLQWELSGMIANHFVVQSAAAEMLYLDGQTDRLALSLRYGFANDWDIELTLPWLHHSGGFTDAGIERWHKVFGLPNGDRDRYPKNHLRYELNGQGQVSRLERSTQGLGDIEVALSRELLGSDSAHLAASIGMKSATGSTQQWLGSGTTDIFALLRFSGRYPDDGPLYWHGQIGTTWAGESPLLGDAQRRTLWFTGLSVEWSLTSAWSALLQYDAHSSISRSHLAPLDQTAGMLSMGLRWRASEKWSVDFGFSEDVVVETAPDINFLLNVRVALDP